MLADKDYAVIDLDLGASNDGLIASTQEIVFAFEKHAAADNDVGQNATNYYCKKRRKHTLHVFV